MQAPYELVKEVAKTGRLPVVNFAAGGVATPADAALMMQLGMDGVFVGSGIFKSSDPERRARAIVRAVAHFDDPKILAEVITILGIEHEEVWIVITVSICMFIQVSSGLGPAMVGITDLNNDPVNFRERGVSSCWKRRDKRRNICAHRSALVTLRYRFFFI